MNLPRKLLLTDLPNMVDAFSTHLEELVQKKLGVMSGEGEVVGARQLIYDLIVSITCAC